MKNKNNPAGATLAAVGLGFVFSYAVFAIFSSDSDDELIFPSGMLTLVAIAGVCYLAVILIKLFLVPYLARRQAALRALGKDGVRVTGWKKIGGRWYYLDPETGAMRTNCQIGQYIIGADGVCTNR